MASMTVACDCCNKPYEVPRSTYDENRRRGRKFICKDCKAKKKEENKKKHSAPIPLKCEECGASFELKEARVNTIKQEGRKFLCPTCIKKLQAKRMKERNESMSQEEKKKFYKKVSQDRKNYFKNMSKEDFQKYMDNLNDANKQWRENATPEELARISQAHTESNIRRWNNMNAEEKEKVSMDAKMRWLNKTPEEKAAHAQRSFDNWANKSKEEYQHTVDLISQAKKDWWRNLSEEELRDICNRIGNTLSTNWSNLSQDKKEEFREKQRKIWNDLPIEEKLLRSKMVSEFMKDWWSSVPEEVKKERVGKLSEGLIEWLKNLTPEQRKERSEFFSKKSKDWWNSRTPDQLKLISQRMRDKWDMLPEEEKIARSELSSKISKTWWNSLSEEERKIRINNLLSSYEAWDSNLTPEQRKERSEQISKNVKQWWNDLDAEKRKVIIHNILMSQGKNNFHKHFEDMFNSIGLKLQIRSEVPIGTKSIHSWDYGIYDQNGELIMVVDLDGEYFHGDKCDYDGLHCREEYDERRGLSVPDGVIPVIINEKNFDNTFDYMTLLLSYTHEQYVDHMFQMYRKMPFPEQKFSNIELIQSYNQLQRMDCNDKYHQDMSVNTRLGDRLILHFHPSIYQQSIDGHISPYDAWYDDNVLCQHIQDHILYHSYLNPNKILQGFNVSPIAPRIRFLSGGKCKMIINKYLMDYDVIFDPNMGYGGTMLGTVSLGKKFIGSLYDDIVYEETRAIAGFLQDYFDIDICITKNNYKSFMNSSPCLFTSIKDDNDIDICLQNFRCNRYVFIVDETDRYKSNIVEKLPKQVHFNMSEYVVVIDKN